VRNLKILSGGSRQKGLGHLSRVASLCSELYPQQCLLIDSDQYAVEFASRYFTNIKKVKSQEEILSSLSNGDVILADTYELDAPFWKEIKEKEVKLVLVNDIPTHDLVADLLINHAPGINQSDFKNAEIRKWALGLKYSLVRESFLAYAREGLQKEREDYCFICMGGADPFDISQKFLKLFQEEIPGIRVKMVVNNASELNSDDPRLTLSGPLSEKEIFNMIANAKIAIVPSSSLALEAIACRTPFITGHFIDNQKRLYTGLEESELAYGIGNLHDLDSVSFVNDFNLFWNSSQMQEEFIQRHKTNIDGKSIERLQGYINGILLN